MIESELVDSFGRKHNYLRISLTDKCNFRCSYCMPSESMKFMPNKNLMSASEIITLASVFKNFGVKRVRFTGGEPLLHPNLEEIVKGISNLNLEMAITTNGFNLHKHLPYFEEYGLKNINISIDSINEDKFSQITNRNKLKEVITGIDDAKQNGFDVKLNMVVIRDSNDDEIIDLLKWTASKKIRLRFIEYMPFFGNKWDYKRVFMQKEILQKISETYRIIDVKSPSDSTSGNYYLPELNGSFGIIPTVSNPFCNGCSRIRLTADGKIKNCLFSDDETDLLGPLRQGKDLHKLIIENINRKKEVAAGKINFSAENARAEYAKNRSMISIGG